MLFNVAGIENVATKPVTAKKPTLPRKKRPVATDAGGSALPAKRVREDYRASFGSATGGKSLSVIKELLKRSVLNAEIGVAAVATLPFVTSSVSASPKRETADFNDVITGPNVRTIGPSERFVISSHSSHHYSNNTSEAETDSVIRFSDPSMMTEAVITTETADRPGKELSLGSREVDSATLRDIFVPRWSVPNDTLLDDHDTSREFIDHLAPPVLFSQIRAMDCHQLFTEYNVGTARQACLNAEVRMRTEYNLSERKRLEDEYAEAAKAKNAHASEASLLRQQNTTFEYEKEILNKRAAELQSLSSHREQELVDLNVVTTFLKSQNNDLVSQVHALEKSCSTLRDQVAGYELFKQQIEAIQDAQVKAIDDRVDKLDADLLNLVLHLDKEFYPRFLTAIVGRMWMLSRGDGLAARIDHGKARRTLGEVAAYNPSAESDYVTALRALQDVDFSLLSDLHSLRDASIQDVMDKLCLKGHVSDLLRLLQPDVDQLTLLIHRLEDQVVIGETSLSFSLNVMHARVEKIKGDVAGGSLSVHDALVLLAEPLSAENLTDVASSSGTAPPNAVGTTALSTVIVSTNSAPPITMNDYDMQGADNQERSREKGKSSVAGMVEVEFEKEELDTTP
ncbi:hypothetical protein Tco_0702867 [Tanacetum coccineum]|uniref:Uncharacterized protein n=1 Tax=Tanacetum coccineum TaxID=301880 RepID=A0ABQ4XY41_9ASTR